jgi:hypothetical protein
MERSIAPNACRRLSIENVSFIVESPQSSAKSLGEKLTANRTGGTALYLRQ